MFSSRVRRIAVYMYISINTNIPFDNAYIYITNKKKKINNSKKYLLQIFKLYMQ